MKRVIILFIPILIYILPIKANNAKSSINSGLVQGNHEKIKRILESKEWVPADSQINIQLLSLLSHLESSSLDSVYEQLTNILDNKEIILVRDYQRIKDPESVKGYVPQREISQKLKEIAKTISDRYKESGIELPEELLLKANKVPGLIGEEEAGRLITDSLYMFPDSIMDLIRDPLTEENDSLRCLLDSICSRLLNEERIIHNQKLTNAYYDSITSQYYDQYIQTEISNKQKNYLDSVYSVNAIILARYNDSETLRINREVKEEIRNILGELYQIPNELTILNLRNEKTTFQLQNGKSWHQWIWLKNSQDDSIGIRVENLDKHRIRMLVDETVNLSRLTLKDRLEVVEIKPTENKSLSLSKFTTRNPVLSPWKFIGKAYAGFTQTYINEYWSQGGKSSASALTTINYAINYSKEKVKWENFADLKLGVIYYLPEEGVETHRNWHKNSDNFEINSRFGFSAFKKWYYSAETNFKTQLFYGYKSQNDTIPASAFLSPGYLTFSLGMEYKPGKDVSVFLSPVSMKTTYVTNPLVDETKFGLLKGEVYRSRVGFSGKLDYSKNLLENVNLKTKNSIFLNFGNNSAGEWQFLKLPDFDSETSIDFKVNQFISTQVNFHFIYDKEVESTWASSTGEQVTGTRLQVKEFFTLGISYKF